MEIVLCTILSYLVSLAANLRTDAILARREERLREQLEHTPYQVRGRLSQARNDNELTVWKVRVGHPKDIYR